jgi:hypothetical protein
LKPWLSLLVGARFLFATHEFRFLFVRIDIFAAQKYALEKIDMILIYGKPDKLAQVHYDWID